MPAKKKNAFFFFMAEMHRQMRDRGEDVPFPQMQGIASPHWKTMTPEQKFKWAAYVENILLDMIELHILSFPLRFYRISFIITSP